MNNKPDNNNNMTHLFKIMLFAVTMLIVCILGLFVSLRPTVSETEKRTLAQFPEFTVSSFLSGEYFSDITTWYADTFPFRESLIDISSRLQSLYGFRSEQIIGDVGGGDTIEAGDVTSDFNIFPVDPGTLPVTQPVTAPDDTTAAPPVSTDLPESTALPDTDTQAPVTTVTEQVTEAQTTSPETQPAQESDNGEKVNGVYVKGDTVFELTYYSAAMSQRYADALSKAAAQLDGKATVYSIIVPKAYGFYLDSATQKKLGLPDENTVINSTYSKMTGVKAVGIYTYLDAKKSDYIFFRTDHHWTALGAYYAYQCFCMVKGVPANSLSAFEKRTYDGFLGTLYTTANKPAAVGANPDTVYAYVPMGTNKMTYYESASKKYSYDIIHNVSGWASTSKYNTFIAGDQPFEEIVNPNITDGSACAVVKDSFGNAYVPFMVDHYQYTYVIDFRTFRTKYYSGTLADFVAERGVKDLIFVNNITTVNSSSLVPKLENLIG